MATTSHSLAIITFFIIPSASVPITSMVLFVWRTRDCISTKTLDSLEQNAPSFPSQRQIRQSECTLSTKWKISTENSFIVAGTICTRKRILCIIRKEASVLKRHNIVVEEHARIRSILPEFISWASFSTDIKIPRHATLPSQLIITHFRGGEAWKIILRDSATAVLTLNATDNPVIPILPYIRAVRPAVGFSWNYISASLIKLFPQMR